MIGKMLAFTGALLLSTQVNAQTNPAQTNPAQTNPNSTGPAQGVVSGPAAGSPTSMGSPQAGPLETKHQRKAISQQSQSVRSKAHQPVHNNNDETGATGSSSPRYASPPK
jgi:hypothetical protein